MSAVVKKPESLGASYRKPSCTDKVKVSGRLYETTKTVECQIRLVKQTRRTFLLSRDTE